MSLRMQLKIALLASLAAGSAQARGPSPYLPLHLSPEIEKDIERALLIADRPVLTRPIAAARVLDALPAVCRADEALCARVRRYLGVYMQRSALTDAGIELSANNDKNNLPNAHGIDPDSVINAHVASHVQLNDYIIVNGGFVGDSDSLRPSGSFVSVGFDFAQLDIGFRDHWLSPMTDSSMLIGSNAATMPSVTLSNYKPITGLGLQYEVFLAEMSSSDNIAYQSRTTSGKPRLAGLHLAIEPVGGWALGINREIQFGGGERGGRGVGDFFNALFKPHEYDNTSESLNSDQQYGNQVAAWTSRIVFPDRVPFSVYFEYAGEDSSYSGNYRIGNSSLSMGIDVPNVWRDFSLTFEVSEWQNGWYEHGVYHDGLRNRDHVIGHWFGDQRVRGNDVGGQSHLLRVGYTPAFGGLAQLQYRSIANQHYSGIDYASAHDISARYSYPFKRLIVGAELNLGRDVFDNRYSRLSAFARFSPSAWVFRAGGAAYDESESEPLVEYFVDLGSSASRVRFNPGDSSDPKFQQTAFAPHVAVGARRAVSERSDLGTRIEFDRIDDRLFIAVRALDYRYRITRHLGVTAFAGAARYDLATPAYGYYGGAGAQWRNLFANLDLNFDIRYADKIARDRFASIPSDEVPAVTPEGWRGDVFYDIAGASLSISYRW